MERRKNKMNDDIILLSVMEVAELEKCSTETVYNRIRDGYFNVKEIKRGKKAKGYIVLYPKTRYDNLKGNEQEK